MARRLVSALLVIGALVVCAWFALGIRQSHDLNVATGIISSSAPLSAGQARQASDLLRQAGELNPDTTVDLTRAQLALRTGDSARARAIALGVTRSEPQNIEAWLTYGSASSHDPRAFALALRRLEELAPAVHRRG